MSGLIVSSLPAVQNDCVDMILITGATGFVGGRLLPVLVHRPEAVRILLRPKRSSPDIPRGTELDVALASLSDPPGVRAAMVGVETVIHLASAERRGERGELTEVDVRGTEILAQAASEAGVRYLVYLSHLGASRSSAYPLLRAKAAAEEHIRRSGVPHLLLRSGPLFGEGDRFTRSLAMMMAVSPGFFPIPGGSSVPLQPLWIEDLVTALEWILGEQDRVQGTYEVGGPEFLTLEEIVALVSEAAGIRRSMVRVRPPYLRLLVWLLESILPRPPVTAHDIDYLAAPRTATLDSMPRLVGLQPTRMYTQLDYLNRANWLLEFVREQWGARSSQAG